MGASRRSSFRPLIHLTIVNEIVLFLNRLVNEGALFAKNV